MFFQRPPGYALSKEEQYLNTTRSKLLTKLYGPFEVTDVSGDLITVNENVIRHPISVDRVSLDHSSQQPTNDSTPQATQSVTQHRSFFPQLDTVPALSSTNDPDLYAVNKLVEHRTYNHQRVYKIRWYGYGPQDDT